MNGDSPIIHVIARYALPLSVLVAVRIFFQGHDLPGGGFVAGLATAIAVILQYMIGGAQWTETHLRIHPRRWMGVGLLLAAGTGAASWLFGYPFLTSYFAYAELPGIGAVPIASALLFDLGLDAKFISRAADDEPAQTDGLEMRAASHEDDLVSRTGHFGAEVPANGP